MSYKDFVHYDKCERYDINYTNRLMDGEETEPKDIPTFKQACYRSLRDTSISLTVLGTLFWLGVTLPLGFLIPASFIISARHIYDKTEEKDIVMVFEDADERVRELLKR